MLRTNTQNRRLHALFTKLNIGTEQKEELVLQFTDNRTARSSKMLQDECELLIVKLEDMSRTAKYRKRADAQYNSLEQAKRRQVFSLFFDLGYIDVGMINARKMKVINGWICNKMNIEKKLNDLTAVELDRLIRQIQAVKRISAEKINKNINLN